MMNNYLPEIRPERYGSLSEFALEIQEGRIRCPFMLVMGSNRYRFISEEKLAGLKIGLLAYLDFYPEARMDPPKPYVVKQKMAMVSDSLMMPVSVIEEIDDTVIMTYDLIQSLSTSVGGHSGLMKRLLTGESNPTRGWIQRSIGKKLLKSDIEAIKIANKEIDRSCGR